MGGRGGWLEGRVEKADCGGRLWGQVMMGRMDNGECGGGEGVNL